MLRNLQRTGRIDLDAAAKLAIDAPYLVRAAYWRYVHKQLRWPEPAVYAMHIVAEQKEYSRCYRLADRIGDYVTITAYASRFDAYWKRYKLEGLGRLDWAPGIRDGGSASIEQVADIFHPGGTTRMGSNAREAIVDGNLNAFAIANLWVASTSVFPSGPSANPTMMLMLFTLRLADHLAKAPR